MRIIEDGRKNTPDQIDDDLLKEDVCQMFAAGLQRYLSSDLLVSALVDSALAELNKPQSRVRGKG